MSGQIVERELSGLVGELQEQGRHWEAELIALEINEAKDWLPDLIKVRDHWFDRMENNAADAAFAKACREFIKGCSCAQKDRPQDCPECSRAFLDAVVERATLHGLQVGENAVS